MSVNTVTGTTFSRMITEQNFVIDDPAKVSEKARNFSLSNAAFMGGMVSKYGEDWEEFTVVPNGNMILPASATVLNYGQSLFEGLKARRGKGANANKVFLFRIEDNAKRMQDGAERLLLNKVPTDKFVAAVEEVAKANAAYIPPSEEGSLYIRPLLFGSGEGLGVSPSTQNIFLVYVSPVGNYFKGLECIKIMITTDYHRAAAKGVGHVKAAGNYAASLYPGKKAKSAGYAEMLYLDHDGTHVEEVGAANFMMVKGNTLFIAESNSILSGITRDSVAKIAEHKLGMKVVKEKLAIERVLGIGKYAAEGIADEVMCAGTAAVISPIGTLNYLGKDYTVNNQQVGEKTRQLYDMLNAIQIGDMEDSFGWVTELKI